MLYGKMGIGMMELQNAMLAVQDNTTVKELTKVMGDASVSNEKKTSFLLQYLLDQREPLLRFGQTLLIALIVFVIGRKMVKLLLRFTDRSIQRTVKRSKSFTNLRQITNTINAISNV